MTIPVSVKEIMLTLEERGYSAHCVGGCVRDTLLGREPNDWDVTTAAMPEAVLALFGDRAIPTGLQHGTVTVRTEIGPVEVTTHRKDGDYLDNRRPSSVDFSASLEEDLARRDFTVNAMAVDLRGELTDPFGGRADLTAGILRCVGDPERRFREDGLRIIRALRFAAQLGFTLERETAAAVFRCKDLLAGIAVERLEVEITKLLCGKYVLPVLLEYPRVLGVIIPELLPSVGFDQRSVYHCYDVWAHTARAVSAAPEDSVLRWTMLFHDLGKPSVFSQDVDGAGHFYGHAEESCRLAAGILERLRMDHARRDRILQLVCRHDTPIHPSEKSMRRLLSKLGEQGVRDLLAVQRADNLAQHPDFRDRQTNFDGLERLLNEIMASDQCFSLAQLAIKGNHLTAIGFKGKEVGEMLKKLLNAVVDGALPNELDTLLRAAKEMKT